VARYKHLTLDAIIEERISCDLSFYSMPRILRRVWDNVSPRRRPLISLVGNLSYRNNLRLNRKAYADFQRQKADNTLPESGLSLAVRGRRTNASLPFVRHWIHSTPAERSSSSGNCSGHPARRG
jgi:hypothetical protein